MNGFPFIPPEAQEAMYRMIGNTYKDRLGDASKSMKPTLWEKVQESMQGLLANPNFMQQLQRPRQDNGLFNSVVARGGIKYNKQQQAPIFNYRGQSGRR
jgi:hypothetical protein